MLSFRRASASFVSFLVVLLLLAACVRNPYPEPVPSVPPSALSSADPGAERAQPQRVAVSAARTPVAGRSRTTRLTDRSYPFGPPGRYVPGSSPGLSPVPRTWRGLRIERRQRCAGYDRRLYDFAAVVPRLPHARGWRDPAACTLFESVSSSAVAPARIVLAPVAHDAGLCDAHPRVREAFALDPDNLLYLPRTVAALRRYLADVGGPSWAPANNQCWFVQAQLRVRRRYDLSVTPEEATLFDQVLAGCSTARVTPFCGVHGF